jgi:hypothetical protein
MVSPDVLIRACTAVIQSGEETTKGLAVAFNYRGYAYTDKREYDRPSRISITRAASARNIPTPSTTKASPISIRGDLRVLPGISNKSIHPC